jgi:hypothetical protein
MQNNEEFWRPIIRDFQPIGPVSVEEVQRFFVDRGEENPLQSPLRILKNSLFNNLTDRRHPVPAFYKGLLAGHAGSGKSAEMVKLSQEVGEKFFAVRFDAELSLDQETANQFDILLGMGVAVCREALAARLRPEHEIKKLGREYVRKFGKLIRKYQENVELYLDLDHLLKMIFTTGSNAAEDAEPVAAAGFGFSSARLSLKVPDEFVRYLELPANRLDILGALDQIVAWVEQQSGKPLLLIADGLDKLSAGRARMLFTDSALLREPSCALIFTAPVDYYHRATTSQTSTVFNDLRLLPAVPAYKRPHQLEHWKAARTPDERGLATLRRLAAKRIEAHSLSLQDVITVDALTALCLNSGGLLREAIRNFRDAAVVAQLMNQRQIDLSIAEKVIKQQHKEILLHLTSRHRNALEKVLKQGQLSGGEQEQVEDELLRNLYLLSYENDDFAWFDTHPNVLAVL